MTWQALNRIYPSYCHVVLGAADPLYTELISPTARRTSQACSPGPVPVSVQFASSINASGVPRRVEWATKCIARDGRWYSN